jgi:hypothetical protein
MTKGVSMRKRFEIIFHHGQGLSIRAIALKVGAGSTAVSHWINNYRGGGDLSEKPKSGRPPTYTLAHAKSARTLLLKPGFGSLAHAAKALQGVGKTTAVMSKSSLLRLLREGEKRGWKRIVPDLSRPSAALTEAQKAARVQFATDNLARSWDNVMFTDRKRFYFRYPGCCVNSTQWRVVGTKLVAHRVSRPYCANIYLGITKYGPTQLVFVAGTSKRDSEFLTKRGKAAKSITAAEYRSVLTDHLLPQGQKLMEGHGWRKWVFQQDNDPTHRAAADVIREYSRRHATCITLLPRWPAHSPDLSLIENGWAYLQRELDRSGCKRFDTWLAKLQELVRAVPQAWLTKAYKGMTARLKDAIKGGGDMTGH